MRLISAGSLVRAQPGPVFARLVSRRAKPVAPQATGRGSERARGTSYDLAVYFRALISFARRQNSATVSDFRETCCRRNRFFVSVLVHVFARRGIARAESGDGSADGFQARGASQRPSDLQR